MQAIRSFCAKRLVVALGLMSALNCSGCNSPMTFGSHRWTLTDISLAAAEIEPTGRSVASDRTTIRAQSPPVAYERQVPIGPAAFIDSTFPTLLTAQQTFSNNTPPTDPLPPAPLENSGQPQLQGSLATPAFGAMASKLFRAQSPDVVAPPPADWLSPGYCGPSHADFGQLITPDSWPPANKIELTADTDDEFSNLLPPDRWQPYLAGIFKAGNDRVFGQGQLVLPLRQTEKDLLFADIRGAIDDASYSEGNFGIAYRSTIDPGSIVGAYAFYDYKRSRLDNTFDQITVGAEYLTLPFEARVNGYIPLTGAKPAPSAPTIITPSGGGIFMRTAHERAYYGIDAEVGWLLSEGDNTELRGFLGGFHFDTNASGFQNVSGPRFRLELRSYELPTFGASSRLTMGAEYQWDEVRDDQVNFVARLVLPLGPPRTPAAHGGNRLRRRMYDRIVRDDDVVTDIGTGMEQVVATSSGFALTPETTAFASASLGNNAVAAAVATGKSTIVVDGSEGTLNESETVQLADGQRLLGAGFLVQGVHSGRIVTMGSRPTINGTDAANDVLSLADNASVEDIAITGGLSSIVATGPVSGVNLSGNTISGMASSGIAFTDSATNVTIAANHVTGNSTAAGIRFAALNNSTVRDNTSTGSNTGFDIQGDVDSFSSLIRNAASNSVNNGFSFTANAGAITDNEATNNGQHGFFLQDANTGQITQNEAVNNSGNGLQIRTNSTAGEITNNVANNNAFAGFEFATNDGAITDNTANANEQNGFFNTDTNGGTMHNNEAIANLALGISVRTNTSTGRVTGNTVDGNTANGFQVITNAGQFDDNESDNNGGDAFDVNHSSTGTATGNTASGNTGSNAVPDTP